MRLRKVYYTNHSSDIVGINKCHLFSAAADSSKPVKAAKHEPSDGKPHADPVPVKEKSSQATKLLDDLFRKTKATPSIYWLPLNEAEVCVSMSITS